MALENGLLLHSGRFWAAAVREDDGSIRVASGPKPLRSGAPEGGSVPLLRGLVRLADALAVIPVAKARLRTAVLPLESRRVLGALMGSTVASAVWRRRGGTVLSRELGALVLGLAPTLAALRGSDLAAYHGAEHKSIGEYERAVSGRPPAEATKEHERCGSNLVGPFLLATVLANLLACGRSGRRTPVRSAVAGAAGLGMALEGLRWATTHPRSLLARAMMLPGRALQQSLTTSEPTPEQLEVGERALAELLRLERAAV